MRQFSEIGNEQLSQVPLAFLGGAGNPAKPSAASRSANLGWLRKVADACCTGYSRFGIAADQWVFSHWLNPIDFIGVLRHG
jgi:hypothetical protein